MPRASVSTGSRRVPSTFQRPLALKPEQMAASFDIPHIEMNAAAGHADGQRTLPGFVVSQQRARSRDAGEFVDQD